jgi:hypothetical protein
MSHSIYLVSSQQGKYISPFAFLLQMAAPSNVFWDHVGHLHTNALHWEGFSRLLWESLSLFFYTEPHSMTEWSIGRKVFLDAESR